MAKWFQDRQSFYARLGKNLWLSVDYESVKRLEPGAPRWNAYVFGARVESRFPTAKDAMLYAEGLARARLVRALSILGSKCEMLNEE